MAARRSLEHIVQIVAMVASVGAFVAALVTELKKRSLSSTQRQDVDAFEDNNLTLRTDVMSGLVFATTGVVFLVGIVALIGRIYHAHHNSTKQKIFFCMYLLYVILCFLGFAAAGVLGMFNSLDWFDVVPSSTLENIRNSVTGTTACSLLTAGLYLALGVVILFCCSASRDY